MADKLGLQEIVDSMAGLAGVKGPIHPWWALAAGVQTLMKSKKPEDVAAVEKIRVVFEKRAAGK